VSADCDTPLGGAVRCQRGATRRRWARRRHGNSACGFQFEQRGHVDIVVQKKLTDVPFQTASVDHNLHDSSAASGAVDTVADCAQAFDRRIESVNIALHVGITTNSR
jgi:hypothetical protein